MRPLIAGLRIRVRAVRHRGPRPARRLHLVARHTRVPRVRPRQGDGRGRGRGLHAGRSLRHHGLRGGRDRDGHRAGPFVVDGQQVEGDGLPGREAGYRVRSGVGLPGAAGGNLVPRDPAVRGVPVPDDQGAPVGVLNNPERPCADGRGRRGPAQGHLAGARRGRGQPRGPRRGLEVGEVHAYAVL